MKSSWTKSSRWYAVESFKFLKQSIMEFFNDGAIRMAASLAFYTMFSIVPAFLIALKFAGLIIGSTRAEAELISRFEYFMNPQSAAYVKGLVTGLSAQLDDNRLSLLAIGGAILAATAMFVELQSSLNIIWGVSEKEKSGIVTLIRSRIISFVFIVGIGSLILFSVIANTVLSSISAFFSNTFYVPSIILTTLRFITQFGMLPILLALVYKLMPDKNITWKDVWISAAITSLLFYVGKTLFGSYLTSSVLQSVYGAAGSLFVLLVWVYYSAQVLYFGAEMAKVYCIRYGSQSCLKDIADEEQST